ncbi:PGPGW domain-containing protein [Nocardioides sp.]|uniref:PGPGW domain-containing protein n=1 Tax=Nocardioides sp. TaxID=35761 RepID=UPI0031FF4359|nr:hypothetical protein [Nocardioides sp.]
MPTNREERLARPRAQRVALEILGWFLVVAGIIAIPLPGPGLLILALGLWVHSLSYEWAERLLEPVQRQALRSAADSVKTWPRIVLSSIGALWLIGMGVLWWVQPGAPGWWPVDEKWWLLGGRFTGVVFVGSGLAAYALLGWSMKRFRYGGDNIDEYLDEHFPEDD